MTWHYDVVFVQQKRSLFHQENQLISRVVYSRDKKVKLLNPVVKDKRRICFFNRSPSRTTRTPNQARAMSVHADLLTLGTTATTNTCCVTQIDSNCDNIEQI